MSTDRKARSRAKSKRTVTAKSNSRDHDPITVAPGDRDPVTQPITITQSVQFRKGRKQFKREIIYVAMPRALLTHPSIRHRADATDSGLSVYEFAVAGAVVALARGKLAQTRHDAAMHGGKAAIKRLRKRPSKDLAIKLPSGSTYEFYLAGAQGYHQAREAFAQSNKSYFTVTVETSKNTLLRTAALSRKAAHIRMLPDALRRLQQAVGVMPPLLVTADTSKSGGSRLHLTVNGEWLPRIKFGRLPWPLPKSGPTVLALYLMLSALDYRSKSKKTTITVEVLCQRLRIPLNYPAHVQRSLDRALKVVNAHLRKLNADSALRAQLLPVEFEVEPVGDGSSVRFNPLDAAEARRKSREQKQRWVSDSKSDTRQRHAADDDDTSDIDPNRRARIETLQAEVEREQKSRQRHRAMRDSWKAIR